MGKWHGKRKTRLYGIWKSMRQRCNDPGCKNYHRYGGRGISICEEWDVFPTFYDWAMSTGYDENAPRGQCTLDRIDNDGHYEPNNCRWVSNQVQSNNRRANHRITYGGETKNIGEWAIIVGISQSTLRHRLKSGWSIEQTLSTPLRGRGDEHGAEAIPNGSF